MGELSPLQRLRTIRLGKEGKGKAFELMTTSAREERGIVLHGAPSFPRAMSQEKEKGRDGKSLLSSTEKGKKKQ